MSRVSSTNEVVKVKSEGVATAINIGTSRFFRFRESFKLTEPHLTSFEIMMSKLMAKEEF